MMDGKKDMVTVDEAVKKLLDANVVIMEALSSLKDRQKKMERELMDTQEKLSILERTVSGLRADVSPDESVTDDDQPEFDWEEDE